MRSWIGSRKKHNVKTAAESQRQVWECWSLPHLTRVKYVLLPPHSKQTNVLLSVFIPDSLTLSPSDSILHCTRLHAASFFSFLLSFLNIPRCFSFNTYRKSWLPILFLSTRTEKIMTSIHPLTQLLILFIFQIAITIFAPSFRVESDSLCARMKLLKLFVLLGKEEIVGYSPEVGPYFTMICWRS